MLKRSRPDDGARPNQPPTKKPSVSGATKPSPVILPFKEKFSFSGQKGIDIYDTLAINQQAPSPRSNFLPMAALLLLPQLMALSGSGISSLEKLALFSKRTKLMTSHGLRIISGLRSPAMTKRYESSIQRRLSVSLFSQDTEISSLALHGARRATCLPQVPLTER